ncbi:MAG TPA: hypothetical protein VHB27_10585 [Rhodopila sp.]|uniref:hypothetical protein n=1 Tax=Rhodopila sp. TaxID=2480087 RepID=UPI002BE5F6D9|nr:hypothetical protein [Rhodopila sp.]HVY15669.1 hypothetical protein [Rhodopila sp.]
MSLDVAAGAIIAYRLFDVAYAIDLGKAEANWARTVRTGISRGRLTATPAKAVTFGVPPVELTLDAVTLPLPAPFPVTATARLYEFGAVSLELHVPVADLGWAAFTQRLNDIDRTVADSPLWGMLLGRVRDGVGDALVRPAGTFLEEDYLVGVVQAFSETLPAEALLQRLDLVPLLSGEVRPLSDAARADLLRHRYSFYVDDLVVLTWDRAFIYEPRGDSDVLDVLEVANAQLLEMRYYDELLDGELPRMYDLVEAARRHRPLPGARRFADLARRFYTLVAEVTELTEKVDNALQVTEDVYLARIYAAALELFRVPTVSAAVSRKLSIIRDTYTALYDEAHSSRSEMLEIMVLVLIAVEIVVAVWR